MRQVETHTFKDSGVIPDSRQRVLLYHEVDAAREAGECEKLFARNAWRGAWVDGIYSFHHCHSTAHEVLGVVAGSAAVILGGPGGRRFDVRHGDVLVLPAGKMRFSPTSPPCRARYRPGPRKDGPLTEIWRSVA